MSKIKSYPSRAEMNAPAHGQGYSFFPPSSLREMRQADLRQTIEDDMVRDEELWEQLNPWYGSGFAGDIW